MTIGYAIALGEPRSCLAAHADTSETFDASTHFEHLLHDLNAFRPSGPGLSPVNGTMAELLGRLLPSSR